MLWPHLYCLVLSFWTNRKRDKYTIPPLSFQLLKWHLNNYNCKSTFNFDDYFLLVPLYTSTFWSNILYFPRHYKYLILFSLGFTICDELIKCSTLSFYPLSFGYLMSSLAQWTLTCSFVFRPGACHGQQPGLRWASACVGGLEERGGEEDEASLRRLRGSEEWSFQIKRWYR